MRRFATPEILQYLQNVEATERENTTVKSDRFLRGILTQIEKECVVIVSFPTHQRIPHSERQDDSSPPNQEAVD
jgi:hypothetical protein